MVGEAWGEEGVEGWVEALGGEGEGGEKVGGEVCGGRWGKESGQWDLWNHCSIGFGSIR